VILRKGAAGILPVAAEDSIEILVLLAAAAPEPELRDKALETLGLWNRLEIRRIMSGPNTPPEVLRFAAERLLAEHEELREILLENPGLPAEIRDLLQSGPAPEHMLEQTPVQVPDQSRPDFMAALSTSDVTTDSPGSPPSEVAQRAAEQQAAVEMLAKLAAGAKIEELTGAPVEVPSETTMPDDELTQKDRETLIEKVSRMTAVEKMKAALTGNMETRALLIRDPNKMVSRAVLQSPKITETEAEGYAAAKNVSEEVLRLIAMNRKFMKLYVVMRALVNNPRAPIDITLPLVVRLNSKDLKGLSLNRNVPDVIRNMAQKVVKLKEDASKPKFPGGR